MTADHRGCVERSAAALAPAAIVLAPYATVALPYRTALVTQAAAILLVVLAVLAVGVRRGGVGGRLVRSPRSLRLAVALYSGAAVLGAVVALARGNEPRYLAGQLLSMALLPLGAVAGQSLATPNLWRFFLPGLVGGAVVAALIHFAHWAVSLAGGHPVFRLYLPNSISLAGASLLALLLAVTFLDRPRPRDRAAGALAAILLLLYIVGSGVRSLWLATLPALAVFALLAGWSKVLGRRRAWLAMAAAAVLSGTVLLLGWSWWSRPRSDLLATSPFPPPRDALPGWVELPIGPGSPGATPALLTWRATPTQRSFVLLGPSPADPTGAYRLRAVLEGTGSGDCHLSLDWFATGGGRWLHEAWTTRAIAGRGPRRVQVTSAPPAGASRLQVRVVCSETGRGDWALRHVELQHLGSRLAATTIANVEFLLGRSRRAIAALGGRVAVVEDSSISVRLAESRRLLELIRDAPLPAKILGHGLGATFPFRTPGFDDAGRRVSVARPNYVHNFYLFLLYKLGLLGALATLVALLVATADPLLALRTEVDPERRAFLAAAVAIWFGYLAWSWACPQILDFRTAPLFGFLLAAGAQTTLGTAARDREAPGDQPMSVR